MSEPRHTLLLVDDEPHVRSAMKRYLREEPYDIHEASDGVEGLAILRQRPIDVIVSDLTMPRMNGLEFLRVSRLIRPDAIRLVITGHADLETCIRAINEDAVYRFLLKPWQQVDLRFLLRRAVRQLETDRKVARMADLLRKQVTYIETLERDHPEAFLVERDTKGRVLLSDAEMADLGI